jgi:tungstate transport system substrate-binding protein
MALSLVASVLILGMVTLTAHAEEARRPLLLGVTTSTDNSGLLGHLKAAFEAAYPIELRSVTAGSGAVLKLAERGDLDVVLVHSPADEEAFVAAGYGIDRRPVMANDFVIVGPGDDPADVAGAGSATEALTRIRDAGQPFLSRGDASGTHRAEQALWQAAGIEPETLANGSYRETGSGQGATLNVALNTGGYTLTDEATFASFQNKGDLAVLYAGADPGLANRYSVILVDPGRYPAINHGDARRFADWLTSAAGQAAIAAFEIDGRPRFRPLDRAAAAAG